MFVGVTVVLELEWVMRAFYRLSADEFARALAHLAGLPNVTLEDWPEVLDAAALHRRGLGFADALHLVRAGHCSRLITFDDRRFARRARRLRVAPPVEVPGTVEG